MLRFGWDYDSNKKHQSQNSHNKKQQPIKWNSLYHVITNIGCPPPLFLFNLPTLEKTMILFSTFQPFQPFTKHGPHLDVPLEVTKRLVSVGYNPK